MTILLLIFFAILIVASSLIFSGALVQTGQPGTPTHGGIFEIDISSKCSCPSNYIQRGFVCVPYCFFNSSKCLLPTFQCTLVSSTTTTTTS